MAGRPPACFGRIALKVSLARFLRSFIVPKSLTSLVAKRLTRASRARKLTFLSFSLGQGIIPLFTLSSLRPMLFTKLSCTPDPARVLEFLTLLSTCAATIINTSDQPPFDDHSSVMTAVARFWYFHELMQNGRRCAFNVVDSRPLLIVLNPLGNGLFGMARRITEFDQGSC